MRHDLRVRSFADIFAQAFRILRAHFVSIVGASMVLSMPHAFLLPWFAQRPAPGASKLEVFLPPILNLLFALLVAPIVHLAVTRKAAEACVGGATSLLDHLRGVAADYVSCVGTMVLLVVFVLAAMLLLLIPGYYLGVCYALIAPVLVVERVFGRAALKRSRALVRGLWWRTFAVLASSALVAGVVFFMVSRAVGAIPFVGPLLVGAVNAVIAAFFLVVVVVHYFDLRSRKEHVDTGAIARQLTRSEASELALPTTTSPGL